MHIKTQISLRLCAFTVTNYRKRLKVRKNLYRLVFCHFYVRITVSIFYLHLRILYTKSPQSTVQ
jgi:hypothetical protein